jgi:hypothetical protein
MEKKEKIKRHWALIWPKAVALVGMWRPRNGPPNRHTRACTSVVTVHARPTTRASLNYGECTGQHEKGSGSPERGGGDGTGQWREIGAVVSFDGGWLGRSPVTVARPCS